MSLLSSAVRFSHRRTSTEGEAQVGASLTRVDLKAARGGVVTLPSATATLTAVTFLSLRPADPSFRKADPSRAQLVFLKSVREQYAAGDVQVAVVDASDLAGQALTSDQRRNFTYEWQLDTLPVLTDPGSQVRASFQITTLPTTLLLDRRGVVRARWAGFVPGASLAGTLDTLLGQLKDNRSR